MLVSTLGLYSVISISVSISVSVNISVNKSVSVILLHTAADMSGLDDQEDDTEYNFWAEKHDDHEKEEFRTDRGVKIPRKGKRERERE